MRAVAVAPPTVLTATRAFATATPLREKPERAIACTLQVRADTDVVAVLQEGVDLIARAACHMRNRVARCEDIVDCLADVSGFTNERLRGDAARGRMRNEKARGVDRGEMTRR